MLSLIPITSLMILIPCEFAGYLKESFSRVRALPVVHKRWLNCFLSRQFICFLFEWYKLCTHELIISFLCKSPLGIISFVKLLPTCRVVSNQIVFIFIRTQCNISLYFLIIKYFYLSWACIFMSCCMTPYNWEGISWIRLKNEVLCKLYKVLITMVKPGQIKPAAEYIG